MKALQLVGWKQAPELRELPEPEPGPGEVVIEVAARQPTIIRENASKMNATYTVPDQVAT